MLEVYYLTIESFLLTIEFVCCSCMGELLSSQLDPFVRRIEAFVLVVEKCV